LDYPERVEEMSVDFMGHTVSFPQYLGKKSSYPQTLRLRSLQEKVADLEQVL